MRTHKEKQAVTDTVNSLNDAQRRMLDNAPEVIPICQICGKVDACAGDGHSCSEWAAGREAREHIFDH